MAIYEVTAITINTRLYSLELHIFDENNNTSEKIRVHPDLQKMRWQLQSCDRNVYKAVPLKRKCFELAMKINF